MKTISTENLKKEYSGERGFVFIGKTTPPYTIDGIEAIANMLLQTQITDMRPTNIFLCENAVVFLWSGDAIFHGPEFFQRTEMLNNIVINGMALKQVFAISTLKEFLS